MLSLFDISPAFHCWHDCLLIFSLFLESMTHLFWNFHSFCPLFFCLLWRCLFWLLLNKRALQVYSSWSFTLCVCVYVCVCVCTKSLQLCHTLCNPMDHSLPGSSNHGILQVRILEWVTMPSSRVSCQLRVWATREATLPWITSLTFSEGETQPEDELIYRFLKVCPPEY